MLKRDQGIKIKLDPGHKIGNQTLNARKCRFQKKRKKEGQSGQLRGFCLKNKTQVQAGNTNKKAEHSVRQTGCGPRGAQSTAL